MVDGELTFSNTPICLPVSCGMHATSQNPGLRLTGDSSLHECLGCISFLRLSFFLRGGRKVVPVHDHLQLVVPGPAPAGVVVLAHNIRCQMCLSQTARLLQWLRSGLDIFMLSVITVPSSNRTSFHCSPKLVQQRHSDNEVCSLYFIRAAIFSVGTLSFSIGVFVSHVKLEWMTCFSWKTHRICVGRPFALDLFLYDCCRPVFG